MKNIFFLLLTILSTVLLAQSVELQVVDDNSQPMSFAYIIINGRAVAVTDTLGYARIDVSGYSHNDTIKVSYLSTSGASISIGEALEKGSRYTFTLNQEFVGLNPVTITASRKSVKNKFFRETNLSLWFFYDCICKGNFTYAFSSNASDRYVSGQFTATKINAKEGITSDFSGPLEISTNSDTTGLKKRLLGTVLTSMTVNNALIRMICSERQMIIPFYTYLGESGGIIKYRIVYKEGYWGMYHQIIAHIDSKTKDLIAYDCDIMNEKENQMVSINCEVERFIHKKPKLPAVLVPRSIRYNLVLRDGSRVEVTTDNMVYSHVKTKR